MHIEALIKDKQKMYIKLEWQERQITSELKWPLTNPLYR